MKKLNEFLTTKNAGVIIGLILILIPIFTKDIINYDIGKSGIILKIIGSVIAVYTLILIIIYKFS